MHVYHYGAPPFMPYKEPVETPRFMPTPDAIWPEGARREAGRHHWTAAHA